ncbi:ORF6N domain-containing protein [bacterium]|nr:ORF6N domain-containing protein [bacterium]
MNKIILSDNIERKIVSLRGTPIILDRDLAALYEVETRALKQAVKRNIERFPIDFMFELTEDEIETMVSQSVIPSKKYFGGAKPFAFSEQGVAMLSAILKSPIAIEVSIKIMQAFVKIRQLAIAYSGLTQKVMHLEKWQNEFEVKTNTRFDKIFTMIKENNIIPNQGIFYDGQIFDAHQFVSDLIRSAKKSIHLIDNYIDESVLVLLSKKEPAVSVTIFTSSVSRQLSLDIERFNAQYPPIEIKEFKKSHDRFLIVDKSVIYHVGASLKDLGKKWFAFSRINMNANEMINKLNNVNE